MQPVIKRSNEADEFETAERCSILEVSNDPNDPEVSIARARVKPGITTEWHRLKDTVERYVILSGEGRVEVGTLKPTHVSSGDIVRIPADTRQRISNTGDTDLIFYAICTPRFTPECYEAL
jgi:mannose-6-phosphate isomerase-like protein (cupin superfamily)